MKLLNLVVLSVGFFASAPLADEPKPQSAQSLPRLQGEDAVSGETLAKRIDALVTAGKFADAVVPARELEALTMKVLGKDHYEAIDARVRRLLYETLAARSGSERKEYLTSLDLTKEALRLEEAGRSREAQPRFEKALEVGRRLLGDDHPETAIVMGNLACNLDSQGKHKEAEFLHRNALKTTRRALSDNHPETALAYNNLAGNLKDQGRYAEAQPLYETALDLTRRLRTDDHPETAIAYSNFAGNLEDLGRLPQAEQFYRKALEINRRHLTDDDPRLVTSYGNLAVNLTTQRKHVEAQPLFEQVLANFRKLLTDDHPDTARAYGNLAANLVSQEKYAEAEPPMRRCLELNRRLLTDDHPETANDYSNLAFLLNARGRFAEAQPLCLKGLEIRRRLLGDDHPTTATSYDNLANNLSSQGRFAEARPFYQQALNITARLLPENHPDTARAWNNLAANLQEEGRFQEARLFFQNALEICRRTLAESHPDTMRVANNLAVNLTLQRNYAESEPLLRKTLELTRRSLGDDHPRTAAALNNLADNLLLQGGFAEAQPLFEKALEIRRRWLGDAHPGTATVLVNLAANLTAQGKYPEAKTHLIHAITGYEIARLNASFQGAQRASFGSLFSPFEQLVAVEARLGESRDAFHYLEAELGRGLLDELAARQDSRLTAADRSQLTDMHRALDQLDQLLEKLNRQPKLSPAPGGSLDEILAKRNGLQIQLGELQTRFRKTHGPLAGRSATLEQIQSTLDPEDAIIAWIDPNDKNPDLHWAVVLRARGAPRWINITGSGVNNSWTSDDLELPKTLGLELARTQATNRSKLSVLVAEFRRRRFDPLEPSLQAQGNLPAARRLIVLNSNALTHVPIEAILDRGDQRSVSYVPSGTILTLLRARPESQAKDGILAVGDPVFEIKDTGQPPSALPEGGLLIRAVLPGGGAKRAGLRAGDVLVSYNGSELTRREDLKTVAEPAPGEKVQPIPIRAWRDGFISDRNVDRGQLGVVLDSRAAPVALREDRRVQNALLVARSSGESFADLPGTRFEVQAIARIARAADLPVSAFFDDEASEQTLNQLVKNRRLKGFQFIHLATHGVVDLELPQRTAVILAQDKLPDPLDQVLRGQPVIDGRISVSEIQKSWDLDADLVTLSACETAVGKRERGEGLVGFTQALLLSGAHAVCLSLWRVDDTATALLMQRFYENLLKRKMSRGLALSEAKRWLRALTRQEALELAGRIQAGVTRGKGRPLRPLTVDAHQGDSQKPALVDKPAAPDSEDREHPFSDPVFWAAFVLIGDPN